MVIHIVGNYCSFQTAILSFMLEICQCENKCMIFFQRFSIHDVSITVYIRSEAADKTNPCLSSCVISRSYAPMFLKYSAKLYHNYMSDPKCSFQIYIIS